MSDEIRPFTIDVSDDVLVDLRTRLRRTRWPDAQVVDDWTQGVPLVYLQDVCRYWADEYDWRARQAALNRFDQYVDPRVRIFRQAQRSRVGRGTDR